MTFTETIRELDERATQVVRGIAIVVQMHLDFGQAPFDERRELLDVLCVVLLRWIEERVLRLPAVGIAEPVDGPRILVAPARDPPVRLRLRDTAIEWLVVIRDRKHHVGASARALARRALSALPDQRRQPELRVLRQGHHALIRCGTPAARLCGGSKWEVRWGTRSCRIVTGRSMPSSASSVGATRSRATGSSNER